MNIHSIAYNNNKITNKYILKLKVKIWYPKDILKLLKKKYSKYLEYYNSLILKKSRENLIKYIIIKEYGGMFINFYILEHLTNLEFLKILEIFEYDISMIFLKNSNFTNINNDILNDKRTILNDDIFYIKNKNNSLINYLLENININKIPINEYENKLILGNLFLSDNLINFYENINIYILDGEKFNDYYYNEEEILKKYEEDIINFKIINIFISDNYKIDTYPNICNLIDPENHLIKWDIYYKIIKSLISLTLFIIIYTLDSYIFIIVLILITCIELIIKYSIINNLNFNIEKCKIDNKINYNPNNYQIFNELNSKWKIILKESKKLLKESSEIVDNSNLLNLNLKKIKNKNVWIRSNNIVNYILIFNNKFLKNKKYCPKIIKILKKIKKYINYCTISYMDPNSYLISNSIENSLDLYLGLDIPNPKESNNIVIKNNNNLNYNNEENGKTIILDSKSEYYNINQSDYKKIFLYINFIP